jgi:hypothetical protein
VSWRRLKLETVCFLGNPVLYPSGTDLRTRIPTLRRLDWMNGGSAGGEWGLLLLS